MIRPRMLKGTPMADIAASRRAYEDWLRARLGAELVADDLGRKDKLMRESAFSFLRGSYWRWAEIVPEAYPDLLSGPDVLAVGDLHLENFGTWRDADGRLVWGVNDFDEADTMPFALDLARLAVSALLAADAAGTRGKSSSTAITTAILAGYGAGLVAPSAIVLERDWAWLREAVTVSEKRRQKFWDKIDARKLEPAPSAFQAVLAAAMPEDGLAFDTARRVAGTGSLGRPRWIGVAQWRGGPLVREAKTLLTSAWSLARGADNAPLRCADIAAGRYRAPDPWYRVADGIVVRRLSPNNRKIEADKELDLLLHPQTLEAMGRELAGLHLGTGPANGMTVGDVIRADLARRKAGWLAAAAETLATATTADYKSLRKT